MVVVLIIQLVGAPKQGGSEWPLAAQVVRFHFRRHRLIFYTS